MEVKGVDFLYSKLVQAVVSGPLSTEPDTAAVIWRAAQPGIGRAVRGGLESEFRSAAHRRDRLHEIQLP